MFGVGEGEPLVADPLLDIFLGDVKNERGENEQGVVTLGEIATEMQFVNRAALPSEPTVTSPVEGLVRGRFKRCFLPIVITFRKQSITISSSIWEVQRRSWESQPGTSYLKARKIMG